jgi:hypothetical protein
MLKLLAPFAIGGLAAAAMAIGSPVTAHANGTNGPCPSNGLQHTGPGHHSFTDSHNNCVNFAYSDQIAYLTDSNFNLINIGGHFDSVRNFQSSNGNTINFDPMSSYDTLTATVSSNGNLVTFDKTAVGDFVNLLGTTNDNITISGTNVFASIVDPSTGVGSGGGNTCVITSASIGNGTQGHLGTIIC